MEVPAVIRFDDVPEAIRIRYFWDWNAAMRAEPIEEEHLACELEEKELDAALADCPECAAFLDRIGKGMFEYAGFTMDC